MFIVIVLQICRLAFLQPHWVEEQKNISFGWPDRNPLMRKKIRLLTAWESTPERRIHANNTNKDLSSTQSLAPEPWTCDGNVNKCVSYLCQIRPDDRLNVRVCECACMHLCVFMFVRESFIQPRLDVFVCTCMCSGVMCVCLRMHVYLSWGFRDQCRMWKHWRDLSLQPIISRDTMNPTRLDFQTWLLNVSLAGIPGTSRLLR